MSRLLPRPWCLSLLGLAALWLAAGPARVAAQEPPEPPITVESSAEVSPENPEVIGRAQRELGTTPYYDQLRDAERRLRVMKEKLDMFEFHGYLRSGFGMNDKGGQQVAFAAPGAGAKYRLGNETETYGEFVLVNNWVNRNLEKDRFWIRTEIMIEANTTDSSNFSPTDEFRLRESFVQAGNFWAAQPSAEAWAGQRFYRRQNIDINDFYSVDLSGYGGGIEHLDVRIGRFALAILGGANEEVVTSNGRYAKFSLDARLYDIPVPLGRLSFWFSFVRAPGGTLANGTEIDDINGWTAALKHVRTNLLGGYNNLIVTYARGNAANLRTEVQVPTPFLADASTLLITDHVLVQPSARFAVMVAGIYRRQYRGNPAEDHDLWISFGARPVIFFTEHLSLAIEGGVDHTQVDDSRIKGWLQKYSVAPQIGAGHEFFSRPVLRVFATYAYWTSGFQGQVGGPAYANRQYGMSFGLQAENWW